MCQMSGVHIVKNLRGAFGPSSLDVEGFRATLEGLDAGARALEVRALGKADQVRLWDGCEGRTVSAEAFVPANVPAGHQVIHYGKNTLPAFSDFEKRFARAEAPGVVYGYNHNWFNFTTAGPGYFVGRHDPAMGGVFGLDYYQVPPSGAVLPAGWPTVRANEIGLQVLIYAKMVDYMRGVCDGVTIGRAWRRGKVTSNYFVLSRQAL